MAVLSAAGRRARAVATAAALVLLVLGALWGSDDSFPFGPMRMYATASRSTGRIAVPGLVGVKAGGEEITLYAGQLGLRGAELEGQLPRIRAHPELLGQLAAAFERGDPDRPDLVELRLTRRVRQVVDGRVRPGLVVEVEARWMAP